MSNRFLVSSCSEAWVDECTAVLWRTISSVGNSNDVLWVGSRSVASKRVTPSLPNSLKSWRMVVSGGV